jgi:exopolyphosphatase/guanosine-5'-triphosphate,3'-diphosphate pyrophosphatase
VRGNRVRSGVTLPLGGLALQDISAKSLKKAEHRRKSLDGLPLKAGAAAPFYAVGGTWRRWRGCTCGRPAIRCM